MTKGSEPLPYTADQVMALVERFGNLKIGLSMKRPKERLEQDEKEIIIIRAELQGMADRYEYMNMHFNPAKSLITEDKSLIDVIGGPRIGVGGKVN